MVETLLHLFIGTTVLMVLLLMLRGPLARNAGPVWAYALWGLVALRFLLPPIPIEMGTAEATQFIVAGEAPASFTDLYGSTLVSIWLAGAAALFSVGLVSTLIFQHRLSRHVDYAGRIGSITLLRSNAADSPVAVGLFHRRIYLPHDFASRWSEEEAAMILAHERVHHERGDLWANLLGFIILSLHWFNPVAWAAWHRFRVDQECACDARVLGQRSADERAIYGQALLKASGRETLPALTLALITPKTIVERIEMLQNINKSRSRSAMMAISALAMLAVPATAATIADPEPKAKTFEIRYTSKDGKTEVVTMNGDMHAAQDGNHVVHALDRDALDGKSNVWITNTGGDTFEIVMSEKGDEDDAHVTVDLSKIDGDHDVWVTNKDGEKFEVVMKKCNDGDHCEMEISKH